MLCRAVIGGGQETVTDVTASAVESSRCNEKYQSTLFLLCLCMLVAQGLERAQRGRNNNNHLHANAVAFHAGMDSFRCICRLVID